MSSVHRMGLPAASLLALTCILAPGAARAAEILIPDHGVMARISTTEVSAAYGLSISDYEGRLGLGYKPGSGAISLPVGVSREWFRGTREVYRLSARAAVSPMLLTRDEPGFAVAARLGVDNRFIGERFAGILGLEIDSALALTSLPDLRHRYLAVAAAGQSFPRLQVWLTARAGYTAGGVGGGALFTELGVALTFPI